MLRLSRKEDTSKETDLLLFFFMFVSLRGDVSEKPVFAFCNPVRKWPFLLNLEFKVVFFFPLESSGE